MLVVIFLKSLSLTVGEILPSGETVTEIIWGPERSGYVDHPWRAKVRLETT